MDSEELKTWLCRTLDKLDYQIRDLEQVVILAEGAPDVERGLCAVREKCEDVARLVRA